MIVRRLLTFAEFLAFVFRRKCMKCIAMLTLLFVLYVIAIWQAHAAEFQCRGVGKCICTESAAPKAVLGYNSTDDHMSIKVSIVCINVATMQPTFYDPRKE